MTFNAFMANDFLLMKTSGAQRLVFITGRVGGSGGGGGTILVRS